MDLAALLKKNFVLVPVVASVLVGTFTGVKYVVNLTDTINENKAQIESIQRDMAVLTDKVNLITGKLDCLPNANKIPRGNEQTIPQTPKITVSMKPPKRLYSIF